MSDITYYPSLDTLVPEDKFPAFIQKGTGFLTKIFYKDLIIENGRYGDRATYRVKLFSYRPLGVDLSDDGLRFVINPGDDAGTFEQELIISWRLEILRYVRGKKVEDLADPKELIQILKEIFQINERRMLCQLIQTIKSTGLIEDFINAYNEVAGSVVPLATDFEFTTIPDLADYLLDNLDTLYDAVGDIDDTLDLILAVLENGIADDVSDTAQELLNQIMALFKSWIDDLDVERVANMFVPYASLELNDISVALEFPRSLFQPVDETTNEVIEDSKKVSRLQFDVGNVQINTESGFHFENEGELHFTKSMIMETGICFGFTGGKLDLKEGANIAEATADGRPDNFKGFFVDQAVITLPDFFAAKDGETNPEIIVEDLLVGHPGGLSGKLKIAPEAGDDAKLEYNFFNKIDLELENFSLDIHQNVFQNSNINGTLRSEDLFKDASGQPVDIDVDLTFSNKGFLIEAEVDDDQSLSIVDLEKVLEVTLSRMAIGRQEKVWEFGFAGILWNRTSIPALEKFLPEYFQVLDFLYKSNKEIDYHFKLKWESGLKAEFSKEEGLSIFIPINKPIAGELFFLEGIKMESDPEQMEGGLEIDTQLVGAKFKLGPVLATVDGLGLRTKLEKADEDGGNLGPLQLDMKILPPKGLGIKVGTDDSPVSGGGYLYFDHEEGRYYGAVELSIAKKIKVGAVGILTTKDPEGNKRFSLLVMISATFPPIDLAFGFTLNGLGGLVGIHRTMNADKLLSGVRDGSIDNILFPEDIVNNINAIITDLEETFPIQQKRYTFGIMALIGWGKPTKLTIELGLLIEVPDPVRFAIIGVIKSVLPDEEFPLIDIKVAFLGMIDFEKKRLSFDASIYNSKFLMATLEGDMALRLSWGEQKEFLISVGGFHPTYEPSASLAIPDMRRLTIALSQGDNPRLTLKAYLAVTSNTVQFGARLDFFYEIKAASTWQIVGMLGLDTLFQFSPFYMRVDIGAMFAVLRNGKEIIAVSLELTLQGPTPWQVQGTGKFKAFGISVPVSFDKSFGQEKDTSLPDEAVLPLLTAALEDDANWQSLLPASQNQWVTLSKLEVAEDTIIGLPSGNLAISQQVVPLDQEISKFGSFNPADGNLFEITDLNIEGSSQSVTPVQDYFAPANFLNMSEEDKLTSSSFKLMNSGVSLGGMEVHSSHFVNKQVEYEWTVMDDTPDYAKFFENDSRHLFRRFVKGGPVGKSQASKMMKTKKMKVQRKVQMTSI
ncbi:MAG: DUF6603 domain-containing protein [Bacteroidota bacterium]